MTPKTLGALAASGIFGLFASLELVSGAPPGDPSELSLAHIASARQLALGISIWPGRDLDDLDDFTRSIGGETPATWTIWSQWGDPDTRGFPTHAASGAKAMGATPMIWWEPVDPGDLRSPEYARHASILSGRHDGYIRRFAQEARAFDSPVILRFAHEANGATFPWGVTGFDNTAASFVAAWRHVHRIFEQEGARNVRFLWSVARKRCEVGCNPYEEFYPGHAYVDLMGFSSYNWGDQRDNWVPMVKGFTRVTEQLADLSAKPIIAAETGSNAKGGDKAEWIRDGYREVYRELPRVVAIVYLDVDLRSRGHPDWRLSSPPSALDEYAEIAALPRFQGRLLG